jgi:hypothetical protein
MLKEQNPPVWLLESNDLCRRFGYTRQMLVEMLQGYGYRLAVYDADENSVRWLGENPAAFGNILAIAKAAQEQVFDRLAIKNQVRPA